MINALFQNSWSKIQAKAVAKEETGGRETGRARKRKKKPSKINLIRYQKGSAEWHGSEDGWKGTRDWGCWRCENLQLFLKEIDKYFWFTETLAERSRRASIHVCVFVKALSMRKYTVYC
jgi:hypothetical protein